MTYSTSAITRALDTHRDSGLIRGWRYAGGGSRPPEFRVRIDLVDGESDFELRNAREAYLFVHALASAHHARLRREQSGKLIRDMDPDERAAMIKRVTAKFQAELEAAAPEIARIMDSVANPSHGVDEAEAPGSEKED
jgi:hypothetical protein